MIASRALAVLAAACFVAAFAAATLLPPQTTLAQLVQMDDARLLSGLHDLVMANVPGWVWTSILVPLLMRPCWLMPASLGILFAGGAMTVASRARMPRSHRRRS